jgi:hypothetical protein
MKVVLDIKGQRIGNQGGIQLTRVENHSTLRYEISALAIIGTECQFSQRDAHYTTKSASPMRATRHWTIL